MPTTKVPRFKSMQKHAKATAVNYSAWWRKERPGQRSCPFGQGRSPLNYRCCFCSVGTNVIPVRRGRFAPACCAAQSVSRRGPGCAVPHHRLPWAALNFHHRSGLHQQRASAGPMNTVRSSSSSSLSRPNECGLTGRSTGHFAAGRVWASKA